MHSVGQFLTRGLLGAALLPLLAGCGGGGGGGGSSSPTPTPSTTSLSVTTASGLVATLSENSATVGVGGSITYTYTLTNRSSAAVNIQSVSAAPTQPAALLTVKDAAGNAVFTPPPGPPPLAVYALQPGQSLSGTQTLAAFGAAGTYTATASFGDTIPATVVGPLAVSAQ